MTLPYWYQHSGTGINFEDTNTQVKESVVLRIDLTY